MKHGVAAGADAVAVKGWILAHKWLALRRTVQASLLGLFLAGPLLGWWIVKGNLNYSLSLDLLPLADPYVLLQAGLAGHRPENQVLIGAGLILLVYLLVGGRAYCSWVCPVNLLTDAAHWLRTRLGIHGSAHVSRSVRYWVLAMTLIVAAATGSIAWELVNPVSMFHRGIIFGVGAAWAVVMTVFLFDLFVMSRGWCGHLCPVGAFYSVIGRLSLLRVVAVRRDACNDCMDCFEVCPEPQVIRLPLKGGDRGVSPIVVSPNCTNCGRCIDICSRDVFSFGLRFERASNPDASGSAGGAGPTAGH